MIDGWLVTATFNHDRIDLVVARNGQNTSPMRARDAGFWVVPLIAAVYEYNQVRGIAL